MNNLLLIFKSNKIIYVIFIIALGLRLFYFFEFYKNDLDLTHQPCYDMQVYDKMANGIIDGDIFLKNKYFVEWNYVNYLEKLKGEDKNVFEISPGYPYFVGLIYFVFGNNPYYVIFIQLILSLLTCLIVFYIAKNTFNNQIAVLSAVLVACFDILIFFSGFLLRSTFVTFILAALTGLLISAKSRQSKFIWLLSGAILGAGYITEATFLSLIPFILIFSLSDKKTGWAKLSRIMYFFLGIFIFLAPFIIRNVILGVSPLSLGTASFPSYMILCHGSSASPVSYNLEGQRETFEDTCNKSNGTSLDLFIKTLKSHSHITDYLKLELNKFITFWNSYEVMSQIRFYYYRKAMSFFKFPLISYKIIGPFAIMGMLLLIKQWKKYILLYGGIFLGIFFSLTALVLSRYRQATYPLMVIFAAYSIYWMKEAIINKKYKGIVLVAVVILFLSLGLRGKYITRYFPLESKVSMSLYFANTYNMINKYKPAIYLTGKLGNENLVNMIEHYHNGEVNISLKRYDKAIFEMKKAANLYPNFPDIHNNLGVAYYYKGQVNIAISEFKEALRLNPNHKGALRNLQVIKDGLKNKSADSISN